MPDEHLIVTFFEHHSARFKSESVLSIAELVDLIESEHAERKDLLRWLKLARFGSLASAKGSLRHDANVEAVSGCEADYDAGVMSFDEAVIRLQTAGVSAIVYTSPSHTPTKPRWRVLCPFSQLTQPNQRAIMVARLNGILGGIIAPESFTLSQSYYCGHLEGAEHHRVVVVNGTPIDTHAELEAGSIGKGGRSGGNGSSSTTTDYVELEELIRRIVVGEALHTSVTSIAGKYARAGWPIEACTELVRSAFIAGQQDRYAGRWGECVEAIRWVYQRESERSPTAPTAPIPAIPAPWIVFSGWDSEPEPSQAWAVPERMPANDVHLLSGHGGTGKSSNGLHLCAAHVLGRDWLKSLPEIGPAAFIDGEDTVPVIHRRLAAIVKHYRTTFAELHAGGLHLMSMVGHDPIMALANPRTGTVTTTAFYKQILEFAADIKPKQIVIASLANVFAGNENDRSQVQQFIDHLKRIALATNGGAVTLLAHPSRLGLDKDGISGSTQWHNGVRSRSWIQYLTDPKAEQAPDDDDRRILTFEKNQYSRRDEKLILKWQNGMFLPEPGLSSIEQAAKNAKIETAFKDCLRLTLAQHRVVSHKPTARNYAPHVFATLPAAQGARKTELATAMNALLGTGAITVKEYGRGGWQALAFPD
jgi:RecA-family ATPase